MSEREENPLENPIEYFFYKRSDLSDSSKAGYRRAVRNFIDWYYETGRDKKINSAVQEKAEEYEKWRKKYPQLISKYLKEVKEVRKEAIEQAKETGAFINPAREAGDKIIRDIEQFIAWEKENTDKAPSTRRADLSLVKNFFQSFGRELSLRIPDTAFRDIAKSAGKMKSTTKDIKPTKEHIRKLINHTGLEGRAMILTLSASGMRVGEMIELKWENIDFSTEPTTIHMPAEVTEKSDKPRVTFLTEEASDALLRWEDFRNRGLWMKKQWNGNEYDEEKIFPVTSGAVYKLWYRALEKAGLDMRDEDTGRRKFTPHSLRRFFRSQLSAKIPVDYIEALMGHGGYLTESYRRIPEEKLRAKYKRGANTLTISKEAEKLREHEKELKEHQEKINELRERLDERNGKIEELKHKLEQEREERRRMKEELEEELVDPELVKDIIREEVKKQLQIVKEQEKNEE